MTALLVIAILVFLIVVHELGHFIAAKFFGVKVEEFGVGYPPRAFLFAKIGDTEYTLNWLPFGGFVRLFGEEQKHGQGSLIDAKRWKQAIILFAGVFMNAVAAWGLFTAAYMVGVLHPVATPSEHSRLIITTVVPASPAEAAGITAGDTLLSVKDATLELSTLTPESVSDFMGTRAGKEIEVTFLHAGATTTGVMRPAHAVLSGEASRPAVGMGLILAESKSLPFTVALTEGLHRTLRTFALVFDGISTLIVNAFKGDPNLRDVVGPVGLVGAVGDAARSGAGYVLSLAAFISVNLAIINLIPIPALDGGRLLLVGIESVTRRRTPEVLVNLFNAVGIALVILLMVTVTYNDIAKLIA